VQVGFHRQAITQFLAENAPALEIQPESHQTPLKISYFWEKATAEEIHDLHQALLTAQLPCRVIYSHDVYLDIVPDRAGLGPAVKFLVDELVLAPNQVYIAADSNHAADLYRYGFQGIVVANATPQFKEAMQLRAYFSEKEGAQGLLEGLEHHKFFTRPGKAHQWDLAHEGFERAISSLRRNITPLGFSAASLTDNPLTDEESNYFAVWSRDGIKTGLWSLPLNDTDVTECFRRTLLLLAEHQSPQGQIPANVQIATAVPDYGGIGDIASIDSVLWFVIGSCRYAAHTGDRDFLTHIYPHLKLAMQWLRAHDSNNCGLIEIPESSDWMDLFPRSYNVLYDEVLWYQACCDYAVVSAVLAQKEEADSYDRLQERVRYKILRQFWPTTDKQVNGHFAETQFTIGNAQYLLAQISPFGFSWRCDVYANLLAGLMGLLDPPKMERVFQFLWGVGANSPYPVKCLYPPIQSGASDWKDYIVTNLLNLPEHYHNGGIWPFIGGLWVRFLAQHGRTELAHQQLNALAESCRLGIFEEWEFNEWLHGQTGRPMGKAHQAWSAASDISAYQAVHHDNITADFAPLSAEM
ncbi:MAG: hypothetical protein KDD89_12695, partial [Anaerolineales bacterium]|nr:hypothetical protein [Anaerolineales bacterium]